MITRLTEYRQRLRALPRARRELEILALMLILALTVLPLAIWVAGRIFLGDYLRDPAASASAGPAALWLDYVAGILRGSLGYWSAFLGPWVLLTAFRAVRRLMRREHRPLGQGKHDINQPLT